MDEPNRLREFRMLLGFTQAQVAHELKLSVRSVSRHEGGKPADSYATKGYVRLYGLNEQVLWPGSVITSFVGQGLIEESELWLAALKGGPVPETLVDRLPATITDLRRQDDSHGGLRVFKRADFHFRMVENLLDSPHTDEIGRKLWVALGELGHLTGWLARDLLNGSLANQYWLRAYDAACRAKDAALGAHILQTMATHADHSGQPKKALEMYNLVLAYASRLPAGVVALTQSHATYAHARLGDVRACEAAYGGAMDALSRVSDVQEQPSFLYWLNPQSIQQVPGEAFLIAGQTERAKVLLRRAAEPVKGYERDNIIHETWLGLALLDQNEIEGACEAARTATGLLERVSSPRAIGHLRRLRRSMLSHADHPEVRDTLADSA